MALNSGDQGTGMHLSGNGGVVAPTWILRVRKASTYTSRQNHPFCGLLEPDESLSTPAANNTVFANLKTSSGKSYDKITQKHRPLNSPRKQALSFYHAVFTVLKQPNPIWDVASYPTGLFPLQLPEYRNFDHFLKLFQPEVRLFVEMCPR